MAQRQLPTQAELEGLLDAVYPEPEVPTTAPVNLQEFLQSIAQAKNPAAKQKVVADLAGEIRKVIRQSCEAGRIPSTGAFEKMCGRIRFLIRKTKNSVRFGVLSRQLDSAFEWAQGTFKDQEFLEAAEVNLQLKTDQDVTPDAPSSSENTQTEAATSHQTLSAENSITADKVDVSVAPFDKVIEIARSVMKKYRIEEIGNRIGQSLEKNSEKLYFSDWNNAQTVFVKDIRYRIPKNPGRSALLHYLQLDLKQFRRHRGLLLKKLGSQQIRHYLERLDKAYVEYEEQVKEFSKTIPEVDDSENLEYLDLASDPLTIQKDVLAMEVMQEQSKLRLQFASLQKNKGRLSASGDMNWMQGSSAEVSQRIKTLEKLHITLSSKIIDVLSAQNTPFHIHSDDLSDIETRLSDCINDLMRKKANLTGMQLSILRSIHNRAVTVAIQHCQEMLPASEPVMDTEQDFAPEQALPSVEENTPLQSEDLGDSTEHAGGESLKLAELLQRLISETLEQRRALQEVSERLAAESERIAVENQRLISLQERTEIATQELTARKSELDIQQDQLRAALQKLEEQRRQIDVQNATLLLEQQRVAEDRKAIESQLLELVAREAIIGEQKTQKINLSAEWSAIERAKLELAAERQRIADEWVELEAAQQEVEDEKSELDERQHRSENGNGHASEEAEILSLHIESSDDEHEEPETPPTFSLPSPQAKVTEGEVFDFTQNKSQLMASVNALDRVREYALDLYIATHQQFPTSTSVAVDDIVLALGEVFPKRDPQDCLNKMREYLSTLQRRDVQLQIMESAIAAWKSSNGEKLVAGSPQASCADLCRNIRQDTSAQIEDAFLTDEQFVALLREKFGQTVLSQ